MCTVPKVPLSSRNTAMFPVGQPQVQACLVAPVVLAVHGQTGGRAGQPGVWAFPFPDGPGGGALLVCAPAPCWFHS